MRVALFNLGSELASNLHEMLGCKLDDESGLVWVDESQHTSVSRGLCCRRHYPELSVSGCCGGGRCDSGNSPASIIDSKRTENLRNEAQLELMRIIKNTFS